MRLVPELAHGGLTPAGVPVRPQLLGSDPVCVADNAARVAGMAGTGVDLNFGCPTQVVNRHCGGAALLDEPELLYRIVAQVRRAVPAGQPVSAKMRLGLHDDRCAEECALAIEAGGASELVVHARTKADGYRPPAYWHRVYDVAQVVRLPVIANGEIWSVADAQACRAASGCQALMLGRGMVANPALALEILALQGRPDQIGGLPWNALQPLLLEFWRLACQHLRYDQRTGRLKQWLNLLRRTYPQAQAAFDAVRTLHDPSDVDAWFLAAWGLKPGPVVSFTPDGPTRRSPDKMNA